MPSYHDVLLLADTLAARADKEVEKIKESYPERLRQSFAVLENMIHADEFDKAMTIAYSIKGVAGTLGWPLVSDAAGYLYRFLDIAGARGDLKGLTDIYMNTLSILVRENMQGMDPRGVELLKNLKLLHDKKVSNFNGY